MDEMDLVEMEGDDGERIQLSVERYFYYNGEEYVLLSDDIGQSDDHEISHYVMKVHALPEEGEDMEEFVPVDDDLMDKLVEAAETTYAADDDEDEDDDE